MANGKAAARIDEQAARWAARLDRGPLSAEALQRLEDWVAQSPRHSGALARAQAVYVRFDRAAALGADYDPRLHRPAVRTVVRGRRWPLAAAASVLAIIAASLFLPTGDLEYSTARGEVRRLPLPDGTVLTLNTDTRVALQFDDALRRLALEQGEILLDVAKDPERPFVVDSGGARVRVTGTSFTVRSEPGRPLEVVVLEGTVELIQRDPAAEAAAPPIRLVAHTRAVAPSRGEVRVSTLAPEESERQLKWRDGMLAFNGDSLAEVAAEFARYSDTRLLIDDESVARRRVVGLYSATDPAGFAEAAAASLGLVARREAGAVRLLPADKN